MSELQLSLIVIGALVVVGVLVYNRMQERAAQRRADAAFRSEHPDALLGGGGSAGTADDVPARAPEARPRPTRIEPTLAKELEPDATVDYVMDLASASGELPSVAEDAQWAALARRFRDKVLIARSPAGASLLAGLQLVSKSGVVGEAELIEFRSEVENFAASHGLKASSPEMKPALEAARELDAFCADRDIQVAIHVVARAPEGLERAKLMSICERFGLVMDEDGRLACRDAAGAQLFALADRSGARLDASGPVVPPLVAVSLTMDLPKAPDTRRSFEAMARAASGLAGEAGGAIVDDNGNVLDERALAAIEGQLDGIRAALEARGIVPGGPLALRLFS